MTREPTDPETEAYWRTVLTEGHGKMNRARGFFKRLPSEPRCKACNSPFRGLGAKLVAPLGFGPSRKNPNFCVRCCENLPRGGVEIDLAILFADVRGSTGLAEGMSSTDYASLLDRYYRVATQVLLRHDAVIDKLIGDEVMALFVAGICGQHYRRKAIEAALDLLDAVGYDSKGNPWLPIGVGVNAGRAFVGNVGSDTVVDFTALGDAVNVAARLQGQAQAGQIVMSESIYNTIDDRLPSLEKQTIAVRGKEEEVAVRILMR